MSNLVIVAIPDENDRVWKVSSDKVPHMTILYLGDTDEVKNLESIVGFVQHATTMSLHRFYMTVDRRGELGEDSADVLFFKKSYDSKAICDFRSNLLKDSNIKTAYDSATQHDGPWIPHLTLGYPGDPAKELDNDWGGFYSVEFTKIAVWVDDYDGPEFLLTDQWDDYSGGELDSPPIMAMSALGEEALEHFGIKGMRWGQRKLTDAQSYLKVGDTPQDHKDARKDAKWLKKNHGVDLSRGQFMSKSDKKVFSTAQKSMKPDIKALNKSPTYAGKENKKQLKDPNSQLSEQYEKDHIKLFTDHMKAALEKHGKTSPSGKWQEKVTIGKDGSWSVGIKRVDEAKHDAMNDMDFVFFVNPIREDGYIVDYQMIDVEDDSMAQAEELGEEFLEHFGVKGMRWGVRKAKAGAKAVGRSLAALGAHLADSSWQSSTYSDVKHEAVHNHVAKELDNRVERLGKSPKYRGKDLKADRDLKQEYKQDVAKVTSAAYRRGVKEVYGENYTGTKTAHYVTDARGSRIEVRDKKTGDTVSEAPLTSMKEIKKRRAAEAEASSVAIHDAMSDAPDLSIELKLDANDQIIGVGFIPVTEADVLEQSVKMGEEYLEHYGVLGMRWGHHRATPSPVAPTAISKVPAGKRRSTKIEVSGGENHPAHSDAIKVAEARAKLSKSGTAALSNTELREVANRLQLEQQVKQLTTNSGQKFVTGLLRSQGQQSVNRTLTKKAISKGF